MRLDKTFAFMQKYSNGWDVQISYSLIRLALTGRELEISSTSDWPMKGAPALNLLEANR